MKKAKRRVQLKPYIAIDIETTGLDLVQSHILQLAAIYDDGMSPIEELKTFNIKINNGILRYSETVAMEMNKGLLEDIARGGKDVLTIHQTSIAFNLFIQELNLQERISLAGKNAAGFDIPILRNNGFNLKFATHRVIDPGSLFLPDFGFAANQNRINELTGRPTVSHDALNDCIDVVTAIRYKMGIK